MFNSNLFGAEVKHFRLNQSLRLRNKLVSMSEPSIMAILNATPDSFHEKSRIQSLEFLRETMEHCLKNKVTFIDLGAHSTRPGYDMISEEEQIHRLRPYLEFIVQNFPQIFISIDTSLPAVAEWALLNGADIINDVEGGRNNPTIFKVCAKYNAPYILTHSRGTSKNLHEPTQYKNVTTEVLMELSRQIEKIKDAGVKDIIVDLGFGFSKSIEENYELLNNLSLFHMLGFPILCGTSRKSMIYNQQHKSVYRKLFLNQVEFFRQRSWKYSDH